MGLTTGGVPMGKATGPSKVAKPKAVKKPKTPKPGLGYKAGK